MPEGAEPVDPGAGGASTSDAPSSLRSKLSARRTRRRTVKAQRSKLRRRLTRGGIALVLLIIAVIGSGIGFVIFQLNQINHVDVPGLTKENTAKGATGPTQNILLVGSTSRCAVTATKYLENFHQQCLSGVNGINSDVIMILHLEPGKTPTLLSIPRDTFVPNAREGGLYNKVDAALADGPSQLVAAIQQDFGIPINHYVVLNFGTFSNIVTALGGISMYFPTTLQDQQSGLYISHSGCVHISGLEALALVRARHLQYDYNPRTKTWEGYDPTGDIGRIERVHVFLKVLASEVAERGLSNPITDSQLLAALAPDLTVDSDFSTSDMAHLILDFHSKVSGAPEYTLPIVEDSQTYSYKGGDYGLIVFPTEPQDQETVETFLGENQPASTPKTGSFTVSVVDGADSPGETATTVTALKALNYDVTTTGTASSVGPISETTISYKAGYLAQAEELEHSVSGLVSLGEVGTYGGADVTVTTGTNFSIASPPAASTAVAATTNGGSILATLLSDVISNVSSSVLASPTSAVSNLPAYDPRACPTATTKSSSSKSSSKAKKK